MATTLTSPEDLGTHDHRLEPNRSNHRDVGVGVTDREMNPQPIPKAGVFFTELLLKTTCVWLNLGLCYLVN